MRDSKMALAVARTCALENAGSTGSVVPAGQDPRKILGSAATDAGTTTELPLVPVVPANPSCSANHTPEPTGTTENPSLVPCPCGSLLAGLRRFQGFGTTGTQRTSENRRGEQAPREGAWPVIHHVVPSCCPIALTVGQRRWPTRECWTLVGNVLHLTRQLGTGHVPRFF
jgi:hypothetical protein